MTEHFRPPHRHHPHRPLRRAHNHTVEALRALIRAGIIKTLPELITAAAEIDQADKSAAYLGGLDSATHPALAVRMLDAHQEAEAVTSYERVLGYASSGRVVFIIPVPPHFYEDFAWSEGAVAIRLDHHDLPPSILHAGRLPIVTEFHQAQLLVEKADVVMFDGYLEGGALSVRAIVAALLDERHLSPDARFIAHARRHPDHTDVPTPPAIAARIEYI